MDLHGTFERETVLATFRKAGTFDPDLLDLRLRELLHRARAATRKGTWLLVVGAMATATLIGAPIGIPLIRAGCWLRRAGARHVRTVRQAFNAYKRGETRCSDSS